MIAAIAITTCRWKRQGGSRDLVHEVALWGNPSAWSADASTRLRDAQARANARRIASWDAAVSAWVPAMMRDLRLAMTRAAPRTAVAPEAVLTGLGWGEVWMDSLEIGSIAASG